MPEKAVPDVRTVRLGLELRHIRLEQNLTLEKAHELLRRSVSSISRIEKGQAKLPERDLPPILDAYGITDPARREALLALVRTPGDSWWQSYRDVLTAYPNFISLENEADRIRVFESTFLPGLLQIPDYAQEIFAAGRPERSALEVKRLTDVRIRRQRILDRRPPPDVHAIVSESALRQAVGGSAVMSRQLRHLIDEVARNRVRLQVMPHAAGAHPALSSFNILTVPSLGGDIAHIDGTIESHFVDDAAAVEGYIVVYDRLRAAALNETDSQACIEQLACELEPG